MTDDDNGLYSEAERQIFWYVELVAGKAVKVACDPLPVERCFWETLGDDTKIFERTRDKDVAVANAASVKLDQAVMKAFGLRELDKAGTGTTEEMRIKVLTDFFVFRKPSGDGGENLPATSPSTESPPFVEGVSPTPAPAPCAGTATA